MGNVTVTIKTEDDEVSPNPIDGVEVLIYDNADVFVTQGTTGNPTPGSGEVEFTLNGEVAGESYTVRLLKAGVSFPPAPVFPISVTDPPNPDNDFTFTGHIGPIGLVAKVVIQDDETVPNPIENVKVRVFDSLDAFVTEGLTDSNGDFELVLEGDPDPGRLYIVRVLKAGVSFPAGPTQNINVHEPLVNPNTNIFDITS